MRSDPQACVLSGDLAHTLKNVFDSLRQSLFSNINELASSRVCPDDYNSYSTLLSQA